MAQEYRLDLVSSILPKAIFAFNPLPLVKLQKVINSELKVSRLLIQGLGLIFAEMRIFPIHNLSFKLRTTLKKNNTVVLLRLVNQFKYFFRNNILLKKWHPTLAPLELLYYSFISGFNSTSSVLILKQIKDKDEMLNQVFMDFLTSAGVSSWTLYDKSLGTKRFGKFFCLNNYCSVKSNFRGTFRGIFHLSIFQLHGISDFNIRFHWFHKIDCNTTDLARHHLATPPPF